MTQATLETNDAMRQPTSALPSTARVVVIGGGAVGCSVLYHLASMGWTDCVLLEKNELTSGSTWHAAGNCPNFVGSWTMMKIQSYSTSLYRELGAKVEEVQEGPQAEAHHEVLSVIKGKNPAGMFLCETGSQ